MAMNLSWGVSVIHHLFYCSRNLFRKCIWPVTSWSAGKVFLFTVVIIVQWWDFTWDTTEWHSFIIRSSHVPPTPGHHHTCAWHGHLHQFLLFRLCVTFLGLWLSVGIPESQIMLVMCGSKVWQTDKKTPCFWAVAGEIGAPPNLACDTGPPACSCTCNTFGGLMHSFATRGCWKFGVTSPRQLKTPITP